MGRVKEYLDVSSAIEPDYPTEVDMVNEIWEYEKLLMNMVEIVDYAEIGFKQRLLGLDKEALERRYYNLVGLGENDE